MRITIYCPMADHPEYRIGQMDTPGMVGPEWSGEIPARFNDFGTDACLEAIFRHFNRVTDEDAERLSRMGYKLPSLSAGDVVTIEGVHWFCAALGWTAISENVLRSIKANPSEAWRFTYKLGRS